jgi:hypothetical protein
MFTGTRKVEFVSQVDLKCTIDEYQSDGNWFMVDLQPCAWSTSTEEYPNRFRSAEDKRVTKYVVTFEYK